MLEKSQIGDWETDTIINLLSHFSSQMVTITRGNGKEVTDHPVIALALNADIYFAHPQAARERANNENASGLIRQYFP